ncbi:MAG: NADH-quinone oxidoreductase subunit NuoE [Pseudomonadota bacterium]|nr:NADH-quinone oxidoreductase subunit NuoE [Pseudomonadota bacterium]
MKDQTKTFVFDTDSAELIEKHIAKYPDGQKASAVMPLLDIAQRQCGGWLPREAMDHIAGLLDMAPIRVYEVVSFYEMYHDKPRGKHELRVCTTTPCWLRGSTEILMACEKELGCKVGETSEDGIFTLSEFECLGACVNAPIIWVDDDYYEDLDPENTRKLIQALRKGEKPEPGTTVQRHKSAPAGGLTTLTGSGG